MLIYIDTEFNGLGGGLLSMALVSETGLEWYVTLGEESLRPDEKLSPWVKENVIPVFYLEPNTKEYLIESCGDFLAAFADVEIVGDWPADFEHLSAVLAQYGANRDFAMPFEYRMTFVKGSPDIKSEVPHNALSDARALRDWHQGTLDGCTRSVVINDMRRGPLGED